MSCQRASEVDVEAFLLDSSDAAFADFRAHYPGCPDCAGVVARWSAFDLALRDVLGDELDASEGHPSTERLEALLQRRAQAVEASASPDPDAPDADRAIEAHLERCAPCRSELALMARFDPAALGAVAEASAAQPSPPMPAEPYAVRRAEEPGGLAGLVDALRRRLERLAEGLTVPSLARVAVPAMGLLLVLGASVWWLGRSAPMGGEGTPPALVARPAPESVTPALPSPDPTSGPQESQPESPPPLQLAERPPAPEETTPGDTPPSPTPPDGRDPAAEPTPMRLAETDPPTAGASSPAPRAEGRASTEPEQTTPPEPEAPREVVLLAALDALPPAAYRRPGVAGDVAWMRQFGAIRSGGEEQPVSLRAPTDHVGLSLERSPTLWYRLAEPTARPLQITVTTADAIEPLLRVELPGPHAAGLHAIDLADHDVTLAPGVDHRWFVSLVLDPRRPARNPVAAGALRVLPVDDPRRAAIEAAPPEERGHRLAEQGVFYDAYDFFARLARDHPESAARAHRDRLAEGL